MRAQRWMAIAAAAALGVAVLGACGGDDESSASSGGVSVSGAWARTSPTAVTAGAAYMTITSEDGDVLSGASVDASVAGAVEVHETAVAEEEGSHGGMSDTTMAGMSDTTMAGMGTMTMREIAELVIPAGGSVSLEPGGYHIMLMDLAEPLELGSTFTLTLTFETAGDVDVEVPVRDAAP